jgi:single-stranded DNA-binding protein
MSVAVLVSGSLFKDPEIKISSKGKSYATATIRTASADNTADFWNLLIFSETVQTELMRLREGEKLSVQGSLRLELYNGKISRSVFVDAILPLRRERKKAAKSATSHEQSTTTNATQEETAAGGPAFFSDDIPFGPAR